MRVETWARLWRYGTHAFGPQFFVPAGQIFLCVAIEVAERRRQPIGAVLARYATEPPEGILQALRQRHKALAAEQHMRMLPARESQPEVIEPMLETFTSDRDAEIAHVGEVR